jgi:hypothetical protein
MRFSRAAAILQLHEAKYKKDYGEQHDDLLAALEAADLRRALAADHAALDAGADAVRADYVRRKVPDELAAALARLEELREALHVVMEEGTR